MIKQGIVNNSILEKKFKILRTSILLGNIRNREETMATYEDTAREIDKNKRDVYEESLASKMYTTFTLEEEQNRLKQLIDLIESRIQERNDFIDDYIKITSNFLDDLPRVSGEEKLAEYKNRLDNINEFLSNCDEIKELNEKLKEKRSELEEKYENKANNEIINAKLEDELIDEFNKIVTGNTYYTSLNYTDIDNELLQIDGNLKDKYDVMNTFISSYDALKNAGISGAEREEYLSYVNDAKNDYYNELEKKYILDIYKLVLDKENDYDRLYQKRANIEEILNERELSRNHLGISSRDELNYFKDLCNEQFSVIKSQKYNIENIDKLIVSISDCENRLETLEIANNRKEIVDLLDEFSQKAPTIDKIELPDESDYVDSLSEVIPKAPNMVIKVAEPIKINVKNATDTAKLVMKKVVIVLEPKRFNNKRDKLKEAEEFVREEEKKQQDIIPADENFVDLDVNNQTDDTKDDVFINFTEELNKELNVGIDNDNKVEIEVPSKNGDVIVPTEIFIDTPPKEDTVDLFKETDPFLDDNEVELQSEEKTEEIIGDMPVVDKIGSVKPNNVLEQIENASKENKDIILPTMGLVNEEKTDVPIVSENYIKD